MNTRPITFNCEKNLKTKAHVCFGISPFNSYFSEERIQELISWGKREFRSMHLFVPDVPSAYTLEALGYSSEKAHWKARRQCQYLQNKIHRALRSVGYTEMDAWDMVLDWKRLTENNHYVSLYERVKNLFDTDENFQDACIGASRWVLENRVPETTELTSETLRSAARYLLTEIPLFIDTAGITSQPASIFCYHQCIPFIEGLFKGQYPIEASEDQGFVIIEPLSIARNKPRCIQPTYTP